jgi:hypothetical protein
MSGRWREEQTTKFVNMYEDDMMTTVKRRRFVDLINNW